MDGILLVALIMECVINLVQDVIVMKINNHVHLVVTTHAKVDQTLVRADM